MRATGPGQPAHLLLDVVERLTHLGIPYAIVGAFAVSFHGIPRSTNDADAAIWLKGTGTAEEHLKVHFDRTGFRTELRPGDFDDPISGAFIVEDVHGNRVDLVLGVRGMDPEAAGRCVAATLMDASGKIIAAEDLIAMKIFAGGIQDLEDVRGILQVSGKQLDLNLLKNLARRYGVEVVRTLDAILSEMA